MEIKTAGDLLTAIASGQGWGKDETDFFLLSSLISRLACARLVAKTTEKRL